MKTPITVRVDTGLLAETRLWEWAWAVDGLSVRKVVGQPGAHLFRAGAGYAGYHDVPYPPRHHGEADGSGIPADLAAAPRAGRDETVLVVDDEPPARMLVTDVLEDLGYAAIEAADRAAGLKVLQSDARIDLLVTDVGLPGGINGRQVADAARAVRPGLKVLFINGCAENGVFSQVILARECMC